MIRRSLTLAAFGLLSVSAAGFNTQGVNADTGVWPNGTINYQIRLGGTASGALIDGSSSWTTVVQSAFDEWNQHIANVQFTGVEAAVGGQNEDDNINDLFFSDTVYGESFGGSTLAVTLNRFQGFDRPLPRVEADIVFNTNDKNWNSYRGNWRFDPEDLRRVLIHELGHALGLDHPDDIGQSVSAVMNAVAGDIDTAVTDDIQGAQSLYGASGGGGGGGGGGGSVSGGKLSNLSVRAKTGGQFGTLILGFAIAGAPKEVLIRGMGPTIGDFGVPNPIPDPRLDMVLNGGAFDEADDWVNESNSTQISLRGAELGALAPTSNLEAILLRSVDPNPYTVLVRDFNDSTGEVLIEAYDADALSASGRLSNLSTRTEVGGEAGILTAGFVIAGTGNVTLLIRGVGPTLSDFGVSNVVGDPTLVVIRSSDQARVGSNERWDDNNAFNLRTTAQTVGAFALRENSLDAALLITLPPGSYTVQMNSGANGTPGNGLIEIYEVP